MKTLTSKILVQHRSDCISIKHVNEKYWSTPWAFLDTVEYRDKAGHRENHGRTRWWTTMCNDPDCPARGLVREDDILKRMAFVR